MSKSKSKAKSESGEKKVDEVASQPGVGAVLSFILPGLGQLYAGRFGWGLFWFIITPGLWIGSGGFLGWLCHFASAWQAHNQVKAQQ
jgi:TM2 domain-containing membrane protein YozV|tara:strand:- start:2069 stop:2329 length:261 start_codon:yes stop_codon:yes gene_type:complete